MKAESKRFVLIGHPVGHSLSPVIHHAAYAGLGLEHRYELCDCPDEAAVEAAVVPAEPRSEPVIDLLAFERALEAPVLDIADVEQRYPLLRNAL